MSLAQGDAVAFSYGMSMTVGNFYSKPLLIFKRVIFTDKTASSQLLTEAVFSAVVNQLSVLPASLGEIFGQGDGVMQLIPQVLDSSDSTPRALCDESTKIRALTSLEGPPPTPPSTTSKGGSRINGFSLWIYPNMG